MVLNPFFVREGGRRRVHNRAPPMSSHREWRVRPLSKVWCGCAVCVVVVVGEAGARARGNPKGQIKAYTPTAARPNLFFPAIILPVVISGPCTPSCFSFGESGAASQPSRSLRWWAAVVFFETLRVSCVGRRFRNRSCQLLRKNAQCVCKGCAGLHEAATRSRGQACS